MLGVDTLLTKILKNRLFPRALQVVTVLIYVPMLGLLLFGPADKDNPANLMVWLLWWPMLCVLFLFAGRIWCGFFCPFVFLSTWAQRAIGLRLAVPDFIKQHSGWLMLIVYFLLLWMEEIKFVMDSPRKTAVVLLVMLSGALIFGLVFRGNAWCRNLCPLGAIGHIYARTSFFKLRANEAACAECITKDCVVPDAQYAGCPMQLTPFAMDSVTHCRFCGSCVKRCPHNSLQVAFEAPSKDLAGQSAATPAVVWFIVLLAGLICFLNAMKSGYLPLEAWLHQTEHPVLFKTVLMAVGLASSWCLFAACARLAASASATALRSQLSLLGALPMIPLLLLSHFGYFSSNILSDGDHLLAPLAAFMETPWLKMDALWGAPWTGYFSPLCIVLGLAFTLAVSRWAIARSSVTPARRMGLYFGLFYAVFACWNLFATWPMAAPHDSALLALAKAPVAAAESQDGWAILWPFLGINAAFLALVLIVRRSGQEPDAAAQNPDFSASHSWVIRATTGGKQTEIFDWLVEQAIQAQWRIPPLVSLGNAGQEIITFLQRTLPGSASIKVNAILRKNKGVLTISHDGQPLTLPDYKAPPSLDAAESEMLDGIELRLAVAQVEHMSYQARLSERRCSFTLRQTC